MNFEKNVQLLNNRTLITEFITNNINDIEEAFLELVYTSSLRFLDTVCIVHDLKYKENINIDFDI